MRNKGSNKNKRKYKSIIVIKPDIEIERPDIAKTVKGDTDSEKKQPDKKEKFHTYLK